jgi:hypothetical protein
VYQWPAHLHPPSLHSFNFNKPLTVRASGPLAPGRRCAPQHILRHRRRHPRSCLCPHKQQPPPPVRAPGFARPQVRAMPLPPQPARVSPPPPPTRASCFARPQVHMLPPPPLLLPHSPADRVRTAAVAARDSCPGYLALGTTYVVAAAASVAASISRPSRQQPLPPSCCQVRQPLTKLSAELSTPPPRETSRHLSFF